MRVFVYGLIEMEITENTDGTGNFGDDLFSTQTADEEFLDT